MKLLVATGETQGRRSNDFCWAEEGEVVTFGSECPDELVDGPCGCRRALRGVGTRKATTTFRVVERPEVSPRDLITMVAEAFVAGGWYCDVEDARAVATEDALRVTAIALAYDDGTVLERREESFVARQLPAAVESRKHPGENLEEARRTLLALPSLGRAKLGVSEST